MCPRKRCAIHTCLGFAVFLFCFFKADLAKTLSDDFERCRSRVVKGQFQFFIPFMDVLR